LGIVRGKSPGPIYCQVDPRQLPGAVSILYPDAAARVEIRKRSFVGSGAGVEGKIENISKSRSSIERAAHDVFAPAFDIVDDAVHPTLECAIHPDFPAARNTAPDGDQ